MGIVSGLLNNYEVSVIDGFLLYFPSSAWGWQCIYILRQLSLNSAGVVNVNVYDGTAVYKGLKPCFTDSNKIHAIGANLLLNYLLLHISHTVYRHWCLVHSSEPVETNNHTLYIALSSLHSVD